MAPVHRHRYLLIAIWMAFHASITAQATSVKMLTQLIRLPIPTDAEVHGGHREQVVYIGSVAW